MGSELWLIVWFGLLVIGPLIFFHELGHLLAAKWLGVRVLSFSIGMGPRLFGFSRGGTDYRISLFPIGGFVRMAGENPDAEDRKGDPAEFSEKPWWARAVITAAGPIANLILAFVVNIAVHLVGVDVPDYPAVVGHVAPGSVVERIGIQEWDAIRSLDGRPAATMRQLDDAIQRASGGAPDQTVTLEVERGGQPAKLELPRRDAIPFARELDWNMGTVIGRVHVGLPAYQAGLREGDEIQKIDGEPVRNWSQLSARIRKKPDAPLRLTVGRGTRTFEVLVRTTPEGYIGIGLPQAITVRESSPLPRAVSLGLEQTLYATGQIYSGLWSFVTHPIRLRDTVAGPIAIAQVAREQARGGLGQFLLFTSFISLALMAMNLLPIPILDGGHVFFSLLEGIRRRPLSMRTQLWFQRAGLAVLGGIFIFSFANDLARVTQRSRAESAISKRLQTPAPADTGAPAVGP